VLKVLRPHGAVSLSAVDDPLRTTSVNCNTRERAVPEGTTHNRWKSAVRETDMPEVALAQKAGGKDDVQGLSFDYLIGKNGNLRRYLCSEGLRGPDVEDHLDVSLLYRQIDRLFALQNAPHIGAGQAN
jgi:hypothetical protein